ncbi:hypothetical protein H5410_061272 [Solanum commersonii]|uniref:Uncharacterized protein n=1 Tax=Solanum commersonii TaxID=4109 RepID=A0A9J5W7J1_SOLCO|nr:hypothetical protein H5410_061272 [Solanum commersonii]
MSPQSQATMTKLTQATLEMHLTIQSEATLMRVWMLNPKLPLEEYSPLSQSYHKMVLAKQSHATMKAS